MANYANLKAAILAVIKTNGNEEITGAVMQSSLLSMINSLAEGYLFAGVATPSTNAGSPDQNVFYIGGAGVYANFGTSITVPDGSICVFKYNGSWTKELCNVGSGAFNVSKANAVGGVYATYSTLSDALNAVPSSSRQGGMTIIYIDEDSQEYVQYRLINKNWSTNVKDWQGVDNVPVEGSKNLVESGGVKEELNIIEQSIEHFFTEGEDDFNICDDEGYVLINSKGGHLKTKNFDSSTLPELATQDGDPEDGADFDIQDEKGYVIGRFKNGFFMTKKNPEKIVGCLGDSLTEGGVNMGNYETTLQALLGGGYKVQNWGVGGERPCTIMARLGIAIITNDNYTLPANPQSSVLIGGNGVMMIRQDGDHGVAPLQQGSSIMVNPCYVQGIECTMTTSNWMYYLHRNQQGDRDVTIPKNEPILMNTGKGMGQNSISIVWMGTNGIMQTTAYADKLLAWYKDVRRQLSNDNFIFIGLHKFYKQVGEYFENKMSEEFGNKFFNIRTYCCTNLLYDAGITPTSEDLENMANGICPASALSDETHFKPTTNACIGTKLYQLIKNLGY